MSFPLLYIVSLCSVFTTFLCLLWVKPVFIEEECQRKVYKHLCIVRVIHLGNQFLYGLVLGLYLVGYNESQTIWTTLLSALPIAIIFILFWVFLNEKIALVKSRLNVSSPSSPSSQ